jgi:hypothetical protein
VPKQSSAIASLANSTLASQNSKLVLQNVTIPAQRAIAPLPSSTLAPLTWIVPFQRGIAELQNSKIAVQHSTIAVSRAIARVQMPKNLTRTRLPQS